MDRGLTFMVGFFLGPSSLQVIPINAPLFPFDNNCPTSGIAEIADLNASKERIAPEYLIYKGLFGVWHTKEYVELMNYIKQQPELEVVGFDPQTSARNFKHLLKHFRLFFGDFIQPCCSSGRHF